jgi:hypothetical protein
MKNLIIALFLLPSIAFAQKKEEVVKKIATLTCECSEKSEKINDTSLGLCIFESIGKLSEKEKKIADLNSDNPTIGIDKIAESVGFAMVSICPKVFLALDKNKDDTPEIAADDVSLTFEGTLESISNTDFTKISVKSASDKKEFIWLFTFEGDSLLLKNKVDKGDKLEVSYREQQFYDPKTKTYKTFNEITGLRLL